MSSLPQKAWLCGGRLSRVWEMKSCISAIDRDSIDEWWPVTNFYKTDKHLLINFANL